MQGIHETQTQDREEHNSQKNRGTRNPELFKGEHFEFTPKMSVNSESVLNQKGKPGRPQQKRALCVGENENASLVLNS